MAVKRVPPDFDVDLVECSEVTEQGDTLTLHFSSTYAERLWRRLMRAESSMGCAGQGGTLKLSITTGPNGRPALRVHQ